DGGNGGNGGDGGAGGADNGAGGGAGGIGGTGGERGSWGAGDPDGYWGDNGADGDDGAPGTAAQAARAASELALASVGQGSAAQPVTLQSLWVDLSRQLSYIFFNRAPSVEPVVTKGGTAGEIYVAPNAESNNGFEVTHEVTTPPRYGTVDWDADAQRYVYTVDEKLLRPGIKDFFTITVNNGTTAKLPGFAGVVQQLLHQFAINLGLAKPDTVEYRVNVETMGVDDFRGQYGDRGNQDYWTQQHYGNCVLMASAMAISQLVGVVPDPDIEARWVAWARTTPSVAQPGAMMYLDETDLTNAVDVQDAIVLMETHYNVKATYKKYDSVDADGNAIKATTEDGLVALTDLQAALARGDAAMVTVASAVIWTAVPDYSAEAFPNYIDLDHELVVVAIDMDKLKVYLNDSSGYKGMTVPLGAFMNAWHTSDFELTTVALLADQSSGQTTAA
ncbi:MAG: hypothetical protein WBB07_14250, partial [Mycobacterium sp.]